MTTMSDETPRFIEDPNNVTYRLVRVAMQNLFYLEVQPQFPTLTWEDCPRRILAVLFHRSIMLLANIIGEYERTLIENGFSIPTIVSTVNVDVNMEKAVEEVEEFLRRQAEGDLDNGV